MSTMKGTFSENIPYKQQSVVDKFGIAEYQTHAKACYAIWKMRKRKVTRAALRVRSAAARVQAARVEAARDNTLLERCVFVGRLVIVPC